ncbi:MAG: HD domain-containing protein [Nitrospiraceae bacterium]
MADDASSVSQNDAAGARAPGAEGETAHLLTHERSLTNKISRSSEAGDILDQQVAMLGVQLVTQLNVLLKTSRLHGQTNAALDKPVDAIKDLVQTLAHDEPVTLRVQNDFLFLGEHHLKLNSQQMLVFTGVIDQMNRLGVGGVTFAHGLTTNEIRSFAHLFVTTEPGETALDVLRARLREHSVQALTVEDLQSAGPNKTQAETNGPGDGGDGQDAKATAKIKAKNGYGKAIAAVSHLTQAVREGGTVSFKTAKRAIQNIVDLMMNDPVALLGLTTLRCHDQYTHNHSVNVSLLSVALGNRAGYPKVELADLGLAALFHDLGKTAIPLEVLNKPGEFTQDDWTVMRSHPTEGVLALTKLRGIGNLPSRMAAASFEHHMNMDFSGYPKLQVPWTLSLTGRILTIADCYDAMTSSRVYRREPMSPSKVLQFMFNKSGQSFDPVLLKLFSTCVGIIPLGSLVLLDTNELAVVTAPATEKAFAERPTVKIVSDQQGTPIDGPEVDLRQQDDAGVFVRSIVRLIDTTEHKIDTSRYFA